MSATITATPEITPGDRLGITLCLALIVHVLAVLGITFAPQDKPRPRYESMQIVLVEQQDPVPEQAPAPVPAPPPVEIPAVMEEEIQQAIAPEQEEDEQAPQQAVMENAIAPEPEPVDHPSASTLIAEGFKAATRSEAAQATSQRWMEPPRRTFISASTRAYKYAAYMEAWRAKVEMIGNLNYPDEAHKRSINGSLVLEVALNPDGSVDQIVIRRSSGYKLLDDAAIRIVELAAPFAPFPSSFAGETDVLHITRTWQFLKNRDFR
ncbi:MAG: energy transducer TonB [Gammaproteobacteria bacterium]